MVTCSNLLRDDQTSLSWLGIPNRSWFTNSDAQGTAKLKGGLDVERDRERMTLVRDVLAADGNGARPGLIHVDEEAIANCRVPLDIPTFDTPGIRSERAGRRLLAATDGNPLRTRRPYNHMA
jgi:hypothetical protein